MYRARSNSAADGAIVEPLEARLLLSAQPVINEFMAINDDTIADGYGEHSDWIELHNPSTAAVDLTGWTLKDSDAEWVFPAVTIPAGGYLVVFASDRDTQDPGGCWHTNFKLTGDGEYLGLLDDTGAVVHEYAPKYPKQLADVSYGPGESFLEGDELVGAGTPLAVLVPGVEQDVAWRGGPAFDDSAWTHGDTSVGYDAGPGSEYLSYIVTDVETAMFNVGASAYIRYSFQVADPSALRTLTLRMRYDDGFAAWLNGVEIARRNAIDPLDHTSEAAAEHPDEQAVLPEDIDVTAFLEHLKAGENILAIQGLNLEPEDDDFLIDAQLVGDMEIVGAERYFTDPTPGGENTEGALGRVADTTFSVDRGFFDAEFDVAITTETPGAEIHYTLDGSEPTAASENVYSEPIRITGQTTLRAAAYKPGYISTNVDTQTYIFLDDVIAQDGSGLPPYAAWGRHGPDWEMNSSAYLETIHDDLKSIPTLSLVMDWDDWFGEGGQGIYISGQSSPRAVSAELIQPDGSEGFQLNCSVEIQGGTSTNRWKVNKLSMELKFKEAYGPSELGYDLFEGTIFEEGAADSFDVLILDARMNNTWNHGTDASQRARCQYTRDQYLSDLQTAVGGYAPRGKYVHLYLNGLYWGMYCIHERPDEHFNAFYQGGDEDDYDVIKHNSGHVMNGSNADFNAMMSLAASGLSTPEKYAQIQEYLDVPDLVDYILTNFYAGNTDWSHQNWYASRNVVDPAGRWRFHQWDAEHVLESASENVTGKDNGGPTTLHQDLTANAEYRMLFADHVHEHFFNGGPLSVEGATALYQNILDEIERAVVGEAARWGDTYVAQSPSYQYDWDDWAGQRDWLLNSYFPGRTNTVLAQLRARNLYPDTDAPELRVNGTRRHGGYYEPGDALSLDNPGGSGSVYYTLDGTDPRLAGGAVNPEATVYGGGTITLNENVHVMARVLDGGEWSALCEAEYFVDVSASLRITEIMYNPGEPTPEEIAAGFSDNERFEYIELTNIGAETIPLGKVQLTSGVRFTFPRMDLEPGHYVVVAADAAAFAERYGAGGGIDVAGEYTGALENRGEGIRLRTPPGDIIHDFKYSDWYAVTDGEGYSLTIDDPFGALELWGLESGWRPSESTGGSPGAHDDGLRPGAIIINEVLAHSDGAPDDWIELHNTTDEPIDVGGWFLSDAADELGKYQIPDDAPAETTIPAGGYLVLTEDEDFGAAFALHEHGDDVYLCDNDDGRPGGYREHVDFGATPNGKTVGLVVKGAGGADFTILAAATMGAENAGPLISPLVINEVMYHPADPDPQGPYTAEDFEFLELYNHSASAVTLTDFHVGEGIGFSFGWYDADGDGSELRTLEAGAAARWEAVLDAGTYEVFARWSLTEPDGTPRRLDSSARYTIPYDGGTAVIDVDQNVNDHPEGWVSLGSYPFAGAASVTLTRGGQDSPDQWTIADAVRFVKDGSPPVEVDNASGDFHTTGSAVTEIPAGQYVVIVRNAEAFATRYDTAGIVVAGEYTGKLRNGGERVKLYRTLAPEADGYIPSVRSDYVNYDDESPWPLEPDGAGASLSRWPADGYGNDALNWVSGTTHGTPGALNTFYDTSPPSVPTGVDAQGVSSTRIDLSWQPSVDPQSRVDHYVIYRDGGEVGTSSSPGYADTGLVETQTYTYEITAVNPDGQESGRSDPVDASPLVSLVSAQSDDGVSVTVTFGKAVEETSAETAENYTIVDDQSQAQPVAAAARQADHRVVVLTLAGPLAENGTYTVTVTGVIGEGDVPLEQPAEAVFTYSDPDSRLLAWWTFDDQTGGLAGDSSGSGHDGEVLGAAWSPDGRLDGALRFDGDDAVVDDDGEDYINGLSGLTVAMWIRADAVETDYGIFTAGTPGGSEGLWLQHSAAAAHGQESTFSAFLSTDAGSGAIEGPAGAQLADWQHVALTWTAGGSMSLYLDGVAQELSYDSGPLAGTIAGATQVLVGMAASGAAAGWQGLIDDVRIYERELSGEEIDALLDAAGRLTADIVDVSPDPRNSAVAEVNIVFNQSVTGLDVGDLRLTRDGGANLLTGGEPLTTSDGVTWTLGGLYGLTGTGGAVPGFTAFNDHMPKYGDGTHDNTTAYSGHSSWPSSGLLKDIDSGLSTAVTLTITASGVNYAGSQANPYPGTDAYDVFNGYVDLSGSSGSGSSIELEAAGNDHYTYTFSGLDTGDAAAYDFTGTAVRGKSSYTDRWTLVTLVGAEACAPAHSSGIGVVTDGLGSNQVAIWTGYNSGSGQGYVARWTDIDPGADGEFAVVSRQYTGAIPTSVDSAGWADGTKGYAVAGIRLEEVLLSEPEPIAGAYELRLVAENSGIKDAELNPLVRDASDAWVIDIDAPTVDIADVDPDPRNAPVDAIEIVFNEPVTGLDVGDLMLMRDWGANLLTDAEPLSTADGITWTLGDLSGLTALSGEYALMLPALGSGIQDAAGNPLAGAASDIWFTDTQAPTADVVDVAPDPRTECVYAVQISFSEPVVGFDLDDLSLTRDGSGDLLTGAEPLESPDGVTWTLGGLGGLTAASGTYTLTLTAGGSGIQDAAGNPLAGDASDTWLTDVQPPAANGWYSAVEHGGAGDVLLEIPDDGTFSEPRMAGVAELRIEFSEPIDPASFTPASVGLAGNDAAGSPMDLSGISVSTTTAGGDTLGIIEFAPALPDVARYLVRIDGVTDAVGNPLAGDRDRILTAIAGDANGDLRVNAIDLSYIWPRRTTRIDGVTLVQTRSDVTCDGRVNAIDLSATWPRRGANMQNVPDPVLPGKLGAAASGDVLADAAALAAISVEQPPSLPPSVMDATAAAAPAAQAADVATAASADLATVSTAPAETDELEVPEKSPAALEADLLDALALSKLLAPPL